LTLASPGTGKTTTIANLIECLELTGKLKYMNLLVLTFTKRTRGDLVDKLKTTKISEKRNNELKIRVKNFHSLAFRMLFWRRIIEED
jgi:superfamily I DNA/RNA helicase